MSEPKFTNRLIKEKSPYLLQHAHNPVDWYPWGDEAFAQAQAEDKPIFLSIGYSTCHWCHVMERESFEDEEVAGVLNQHFISIKVDREERPDIDHIYMTVCQGMTGQGGWPLTIVMTPDKKPFFAGTYFPKRSRGGMTGMLELLPQIAGRWGDNREALRASGDKVHEWLLAAEENERENISPHIFSNACKTYYQTFDREYGGFGPAPKFPAPHNLLFLLRYYHLTGEQKALQMVEKTLEKMYQGGIYDHIGGGFARYATDRFWLVPHFEKMLYDNALLTMAFTETWQISRNPRLARTAAEVLDYVLRDMTAAEGGFYSAEDADSEGEEGKFYIWNQAEILAVLGQAAGNRFCAVYDVTAKGNFEDSNIPNLLKSQADESVVEELEESRKKLFAHREARVHPHKDDKILSGWNGLMTAVLAKAYAVWQNPRHLDAAKKAVAFMMTRMRRPDGRLLARYRQGEALYPAYAADYSYWVWALIELYQAAFDSFYLQTALELNDEMLKYCRDEKKGGLFFYGKDGEQLLTRPKESYDGAMPSANSVATLNFLRLAKLTGDSRLEELAHEQLQVFGQNINDQPTAHSFFLAAAMFALKPTREIVITGETEREGTRAMLRVVREKYLPDTVAVFKPAEDGAAISKLAPYLQDVAMAEGKTTAYICRNFACREPVTDIEEFKTALAD